MELTAITLARAVALIEVQTWDPFGKATTLEAIQRLTEKYTFGVVPQKFSEIDFQKGVELLGGRFGNIVVDRLSIFVNGIMVDTRSSTEDAEKVVTDLLDLAKILLGAVVRPQRINFTSQVVFRSNMRLGLLNPILEAAAERISSDVSSDMKHPYRFEPTAVIINADLSQAKIAPAVFSIERRANIPFEENTYFSNAPLRTAEHLGLLEQIEKVLLPDDHKAADSSSSSGPKLARRFRVEQ